MRRAWAVALCVVFATVAEAQVADVATTPSQPTQDQTAPAQTAPAQTAPAQAPAVGVPLDGPAFEVPSPVVTVDQDRLFNESAWGRRVLAEVEDRSRALSAENRRIEDELIAEEQQLTDLRPEMAPEAFRERAAAFDEKVQRLRAEQDAKTRDLAVFRDNEQQRFFAEVLDVLTEVVLERGAVVILDQRAIVLSVTAIDITDDAIRRIDTAVGDGGAP